MLVPRLPPMAAMLPWRMRFCKQADQGASGQRETSSRCQQEDLRILPAQRFDWCGGQMGITENGTLP